MKEDRERYYKFSNYLKERFGCRVYKVSVDAGFSCPNKDGKISREGCLYCDNRAFSFVSKEGACGDEFSNGAHIPSRPVEKQIEEGIASGRRKFAVEKFIVYFQAHSNTYATLDILKEKYDAVKKFKDIIGIAIGTRPDCINEETLNLIESYTQDYEVWIEYGLQSIHEKTLEFINRGHVYKDFLEAVRLTRGKRNIKICAHLIIGLPNETREDILQTAVELGRLKLEGIKIHPLHVIRGTKLEKLLSRGSFTPLDFDEYIGLAVDFLELLWPNTVIQRIAADCPRDLLVAPLWLLEKNRVLQAIGSMLIKKDKYQGRLFKE